MDLWNNEDEKILKEWADKAQCYEWMHHRSHKIYKKRYLFLTIPVIIISTLTGTANFAQERVPVDYQGWYSMVVGAFNLIAGMITTVAQFMKISELSSSHEHSSKDWDKFSRNIKMELVKNRKERQPKKSMIEISKKEYDRLLENSPTIPHNIVRLFNDTFKDTSNLILPEICDKIYPIEVYSEEIRETAPIMDENKRMEKIKGKFYELNGRFPTEIELDDMVLDDSMV